MNHDTNGLGKEHPRSREVTKQDLIDILVLLGMQEEWTYREPFTRKARRFRLRQFTVPTLRELVRTQAAKAGAALKGLEHMREGARMNAAKDGAARIPSDKEVLAVAGGSDY